MTNLLRLLLLLLMGGSLVAARWADGLGQRLPATATLRPRLPKQPTTGQAWLPYAGWPPVVHPVSTRALPKGGDNAPVAHAL